MQQERNAHPNARRHWFAAPVLLAGLLLVACAGEDGQPATDAAESAQAAPEGATGASPRNAVIAQRHMVVAANPLATEAGEAILQAGGSAVDAAIAVQMVLTLVEPQSSGIGG